MTYSIVSWLRFAPVQVRSFTSTPVLLDRTDHPLYKTLDWAKVEGNKIYAIVNPVDSGDILYILPGEFLRIVRAYASSEGAIVVLATPNSRRPGGGSTSGGSGVLIPNSGSFPKSSTTPGLQVGYTQPFIWMGYSYLRAYQPGRDSGESTILPLDSNIQAIITIWCSFLQRATMGTDSLSEGRILAKSFRFMRNILKVNGSAYLCLYLKASYLYTFKYVGGETNVDNSVYGLSVGLTHGLPSWLPLEVRAKVRSRDVGMIRFIGSMLFSYKGFSAGPQYADLTSITTVHPPIESVPEFNQVAVELWEVLRTRHSRHFPTYIPGAKAPGDFMFEYAFQPQTSAGPSSQISVESFHDDLLQFFIPDQRSPGLALRKFGGTWREGAQTIIDRYWRMVKDEMRTAIAGGLKYRPLGRLCTKVEAAGKIRVFAIVDNLTQILLRPIHNFLMEGLKGFG